ncbi:hypothetical protein S7711_04683 [Stachybotrys chartarum IBT 7711]|uniref:Protoheme IX farnesyltransferase, mitochondrial n=1 Tax=Stachybotrys chartarum (strain CBS 109288 / IBT 7711) TaxID=1280523 RepID=A0A084B641_STACB|nr:hypothetical protein S7711_04683 [Stachybotrys chartarum IBT 7711]KFA55651.1 hypothetical protein S40293_05257 [Stachybotrys chartarum IBT 40293]KFA72793.1 hypothetical protein S40288_06379 [Stachybotrys chartarum IBT 40288]
MRPPRIPPRAVEFPKLLACSSRRCRPFSSAVGLQAPRAGAVTALAPSAFFLSNRLFDRSNCLEALVSNFKPRASSTTSAAPPSTTLNTAPTPPSPVELPPHRRRQALKQANAAASAASDVPMPPDASSLLAADAAAQPSQSFRRTFSTLLSLSKPRLTVLITLTAMASYAIYPVPELLASSTTETPSLSPLTLLFLTVGTTLCASSANALNMMYEQSTDAKMSRTRNRPLVRKLISTRSALLFAVLTGATGVAALYFGVNPTVSFLGFGNILLYAGVYTPLKAVSPINTWVGAIVGGIQPLMGWAAAAGEVASTDGSWRELLFASDGSSIGGWLLGGLLFAWQFPHFMALSWSIREDYKAAGLRMLSWTNPARNARVALRYSLVFIPLCVGLCAAGITDWTFSVTSLPINLWLIRESVTFYRHQGHKGSARGLFWASVWHLPVVMILALLHKKGMWSRAWRSVFGAADEEGEWEDDDELQEMASMTAMNVAHKAETVKGR